MLDLTKKVLPSAVEVDGAFFAVKTDFRTVLAFFALLADGTHTYADFDFMYTSDGVPANRKAGVDAMIAFFNRENPLPRKVGSDSADHLLDYEQDADLIYSAFREQYGINLLTEDLHWYEFRALLSGLHGTKLNDVIGFRAYDATDHRKSEQIHAELKQAWALETKLTEAEQKALDDFEKDFG
ncbi:MAG: bacteriophage Gp15 family protein [Treponema sp.]|nr:bacteriophage Gp15 family protein [Treponema sp.]